MHHLMISIRVKVTLIKTMAFGEFVHNEVDLVKMIMEYVENECGIKD